MKKGFSKATATALIGKLIKMLFLSVGPAQWLDDSRCTPVNIHIMVPKVINDLIQNISESSKLSPDLIYTGLFRLAGAKCSEEAIIESIKMNILKNLDADNNKTPKEAMRDLTDVKTIGSA